MRSRAEQLSSWGRKGVMSIKTAIIFNNLTRPRRSSCVLFVVISLLLFVSVHRFRRSLPLHSRLDAPLFRTVLEVHDDIELAWALPNNEPDRARAVVLLAHGCGHSAKDWGEGGLPVERSIMREIVGVSKFAAIAVSLTGPLGCRGKRDAARVVRALRHVFSTSGGSLEKLPLFALGVSSGGAFAAELPLRIQIAGVCVIAAAPSKGGKLAFGRNKYPPAAFVHFARDKATAKAVKNNLRALRSSDIPTTEFRILPKQLNSTFFSSQIPAMSVETSMVIYKSFARQDIIDDDGWLRQDPRSSNWREFLTGIKGLENDSLKPDKSSVSELMNVAWGQHELTSEHISEVLHFFNSHGVHEKNAADIR